MFLGATILKGLKCRITYSPKEDLIIVKLPKPEDHEYYDDDEFKKQLVSYLKTCGYTEDDIYREELGMQSDDEVVFVADFEGKLTRPVRAKLAEAGLEIRDGKVRKADVAKAIDILSSEELTKEAFLDGLKPFVKRIMDLHEELMDFAEKGDSIKGEFVSVDFYGEEADSYNSLGEALVYTCELELVADALDNFIKRHSK